jgi:HD domain
MVIHLFQAKAGKGREVNVDLETLAALYWMHQDPGASNQMHDKAEIKEDQEDASLDLDWENRSIKVFWEHYIVPVRSSIPVSLLKVIHKILAELDCDDSLSVIKGDEETPAMYRGLGTPLRDHSLNVARDLLKILDGQPDSKMLTGKALVAALGHDIGKSPIVGMENIPGHAVKGSVWIQKELKDEKNMDDIAEAIRMHHAEKSELNRNKDNLILGLLVQANKDARDQELMQERAGGEKPKPNLKLVKSERTTPNSESEQKKDAAQEPDTEQTPDDERVQAEDNGEWFDSHVFLQELKSRITSKGFEAFVLGDNGYFSVQTIRDAVNGLRKKSGLAEFDPATPTSTYLDLVQSRITGMRNKKCVLKFAGKFSNMKKWYFICDRNLLGESKDKDLAPRDPSGRWLKKISEIIAEAH